MIVCFALQLMQTSLQVILLSLVLKHLTVDGAFLVFLKTQESATCRPFIQASVGKMCTIIDGNWTESQREGR